MKKGPLDVVEYFQTLSFAPDELIEKLKNPTDIKNNFEKMKIVLLKVWKINEVTSRRSNSYRRPGGGS